MITTVHTTAPQMLSPTGAPSHSAHRIDDGRELVDFGEPLVHAGEAGNPLGPSWVRW